MPAQIMNCQYPRGGEGIAAGDTVHAPMAADVQAWACTQVETLRLSWCKLGLGEGAKSIADLLLFNTSLVTVDLRGNNFGDPGAFQIARALRELTNERLAELDLGYNEIKDEGACQLALVRHMRSSCSYQSW